MATSDNKIIKDTRLIGYVRVVNKDDIWTTGQDSNIESFAGKEGIDIVQIEHEVSNATQIMRLGLWKALRHMTCIHCEPKQMPMADMYEYWFKEATRPCTCHSPEALNGIIVQDITILSSTPSQGARFTLDMCVNKKHVFVSREKRCLSCCNPQAQEFVKRQMLDK